MPKKIQRFRFKVNGKDYNNIDPKKQTKIRWFISDKGKMEKVKGKFWSKEANVMWDKLTKSGIIQKIEKSFADGKLQGHSNIIYKEVESQPEPEPEPEPEPAEPEPEPEQNQSRARARTRTRTRTRTRART